MSNNVTANPGSGGAVFATLASAAGIHTPVNIAGYPVTVTIRVNYTSAQTNAAILTPTSGKRLVATRIHVAAANSNTTSPSILIGFAAATTPTGAGVVYAHPGLPGGLQGGDGNGGGILAIGAVDDKLLITTGTITGGSIDVVVSYAELEAS